MFVCMTWNLYEFHSHPSPFSLSISVSLCLCLCPVSLFTILSEQMYFYILLYCFASIFLLLLHSPEYYHYIHPNFMENSKNPTDVSFYVIKHISFVWILFYKFFHLWFLFPSWYRPFSFFLIRSHKTRDDSFLKLIIRNFLRFFKYNIKVS